MYDNAQTTPESAAIIYPLVSDEGNRRVLGDWLADHDSYTLAGDDVPITEADFDLCIVDREGLRRHRDELVEIKSEARPVLLPVLLLGSERRSEELGTDHPTIADDAGSAVDEIVSLPVRQAELKWRIKTLLRLRGQSLELRTQTNELRLFRKVAEASGHAIYVTDRNGVIEYVNPAFEEITGYDRAEALGKQPSMLQSGEYDDDLYEELWTTIHSGKSWQREMIDVRKDGERIVLEQTVSPVLNGRGETEAFVAVAQDVTERKRYERRLEEQRDDLELLNQVVRHDIRNDLQLVRGYTDLLAEHVDEAGDDDLRTIRERTDNAIALTESARDLADVMLKSDSENTTVDLGSTLRGQLEESRAAHGDAVIELRGSVPDVAVIADSMLTSVFQNLLNNAVQHNDKATPRVTVSAERHDDTVTVRTADNGPGVPDARKDEIFGKGQKGLESAGTGIGLYLVQSLLDSYGGAAWVEDREKRRPSDGQPQTDRDPGGAVFVVELPIAR